MKRATVGCCLATMLLSAAPRGQPPAPADPLPAVVRQLRDPAQRPAARIELLRAGAPAAAALAGLLLDPQLGTEGEDFAARETAVDVLWQLGPDARPAIDALLTCLEHKDLKGLRGRMVQALGRCAPWHRDQASGVAKALGRIATDNSMLGVDGFFAALARLQFDPTQSLDELAKALADESPLVREAAAEALALRLRVEPPAEEARKAMLARLRAALDDDHPEQFRLQWDWNGSNATTSGGAHNGDAIRSALSLAIAALDPTLPETMAGHRSRLQHLDPRVRQEAARALALLGHDAADAVTALLRALEDPELQVARESATALGLIGTASDAVRAGLEQAAGSGDRQLAARARAALRQLGR